MNHHTKDYLTVQMFKGDGDSDEFLLSQSLPGVMNVIVKEKEDHRT